MNAIRHILVGSDFSEASQKAVDAAQQLCRTFGARLTLLHAYPSALLAFGSAGLDEGMAIGHEVHDALARLKNKVTGVADVHVELVADASPAAVLVDWAVGHDVDLIVVGSNGYGAARRFLLGSVAERVARHAPCSVLIAR